MSTEKIMEQPVNARLLEALKGLMALSDHRVDLRDAAKAARSAIAEAEAQQERLLQDMHDAGREIDRVTAETEKKAVRLTNEEIYALQVRHNADFYAGLVVDRLSFLRNFESAVLRKNEIEVAE